MSNKLTDLEKEAEEKSILYFVKLEIEDKADILFTGMKTGVMPRQNRERLAQAEGYKDCYMEIKQQVIKGKIEVLKELHSENIPNTEFSFSCVRKANKLLAELKQLETPKDMKNSKQPINPTMYQKIGDGADDFAPAFPNQKNGYEVMFGGLTKREYFAGLAMQGLLANSAQRPSPDFCKSIASHAIYYANELLKQLEDYDQ